MYLQLFFSICYGFWACWDCASSIAALISVCILEIILYKDGFIKLNSLFNKFNVMILVASLSLIIFLHFFSQSINFII